MSSARRFGSYRSGENAQYATDRLLMARCEAIWGQREEVARPSVDALRPGWLVAHLLLAGVALAAARRQGCRLAARLRSALSGHP